MRSGQLHRHTLVDLRISLRKCGPSTHREVFHDYSTRNSVEASLGNMVLYRKGTQSPSVLLAEVLLDGVERSMMSSPYASVQMHPVRPRAVVPSDESLPRRDKDKWTVQRPSHNRRVLALLMMTRAFFRPFRDPTWVTCRYGRTFIPCLRRSFATYATSPSGRLM